MPIIKPDECRFNVDLLVSGFDAKADRVLFHLYWLMLVATRIAPVGWLAVIKKIMQASSVMRKS
jgi:hypothetical protein